jgi:hypothetical protein
MSAFKRAGCGGSLPYRVIRRDKKLYKKEGAVQKAKPANYSLFFNNLRMPIFGGTGPRSPWGNGEEFAPRNSSTTTRLAELLKPVDLLECL